MLKAKPVESPAQFKIIQWKIQLVWNSSSRAVHAVKLKAI